MKLLLSLVLISLLIACYYAPNITPQQYRTSIECIALLNLMMGLQQQDRNIPDADLANTRNAWIRKAMTYEDFSQSQLKTDVAKLGNTVVKSFNGDVTSADLKPLVNRCLLR